MEQAEHFSLTAGSVLLQSGWEKKKKKRGRKKEYLCADHWWLNIWFPENMRAVNIISVIPLPSRIKLSNILGDVYKNATQM